MNIKFNLEGIKVNVPGQEVNVEIGKLSYEVENLSMTESVGVLREMPSIIREMRRAIEEPFDVEKEAEAYSDAVQRFEEERASKSYIKTPSEIREEARRDARRGLAGADNDGDKVTSIIGNNINPELQVESEPEMEESESHS